MASEPSSTTVADLAPAVLAAVYGALNHERNRLRRCCSTFRKAFDAAVQAKRHVPAAAHTKEFYTVDDVLEAEWFVPLRSLNPSKMQIGTLVLSLGALQQQPPFRRPRFERVEVPSVIVNCDERVTAIGKEFGLGCKVQRIFFQDALHVATIGASFLSQVSMDNGVLDLSAFGCVETLEPDFLCELKGVRRVSLANCDRLRTIGHRFMIQTSVEDVELPAQDALESIGDDFLAESDHLIRLSVGPCLNLKSIGGSFLMRCASLKHISLSLPALVSLGNSAFSESKQLEELDVRGTGQLKRVPSFFATSCPRLQKLTFDDLTSVQSIGDDFASQCGNLSTLALPDILPALSSIGTDFLSRIGADMRQFALPRCPQLVVIESGFLYGNPSIDRVYVADCPALHAFGPNALCGRGENKYTVHMRPDQIDRLGKCLRGHFAVETLLQQC